MGLDIYFSKIRKGDLEKKNAYNARLDILYTDYNRAWDELSRTIVDENHKLIKIPKPMTPKEKREALKEYDNLIDALKKERNEVVDESEIAYFRKVNFLLPYFGYDGNGFDMIIGKEQIESLVETCDKVLANHELASKLLPTKDGFFFGSIEYDDYYFGNVADVRYNMLNIIEKVDFSKYDLVLNCDW